MKTIKTLSLLLLAVVPPFIFSGCSDNDEEPESHTNKTEVHEYVDLGLTVKWATCNIGAETPSDYGDCFAWGEINSKSEAEFTMENSITYGMNLNDIAGNPTYDAASANWGSLWRMPTADEIDELVDECEWEWTTQGDHEGYKVTGTNGNSIFLPDVCRRRTGFVYSLYAYFYWSSTPNDEDTNRAYCFIFYSDYFHRGWEPRFGGGVIRPVTE